MFRPVDTAYIEGIKDHAEGKRRHENPYFFSDHSDLVDAWEKGWLDADDIKHKIKMKTLI